jgi:hypothetical protein
MLILIMGNSFQKLNQNLRTKSDIDVNINGSSNLKENDEQLNNQEDNQENNQVNLEQIQLKESEELNFMGGLSHKPSPITKLKIVWSSCFFGENQYYRNGDKVNTSTCVNQLNLANHMIYPELINKTSTEIFIQTLRDALAHDFKATIDFASELRNEYNMRLGPQIILVEASIHPSRQQFNKLNPMYFRKIASQVILLPTDIKSQLDYYIKIFGSKSRLPNILKRCWVDYLVKLDKYKTSKYKTLGSIIDLIRISHTPTKINASIDELIKTSDIKVEENLSTWEKLSSSGKSFKQIVEILGNSFPHMALLRNLRNICKQVDNQTMCKLMDLLEKGVPNGKQFPFRYYSAYQEIKNFNQTAETQEQNQYVKTKKVRYMKKPKKGSEGWKWAEFKKQQKQLNNQANQIQPAQPVQEIPVEQVEQIEQFDFQVIELNIQTILLGLEKCMRKAIENFPSLSGNVVSLCDNSGSAWGAFTSEYGTQTVATIGNLSGLITAMSAEGDGWVGVFGDRLEMYKVDKSKGILEQLDIINKIGQGVGGGTEHGLYLWFEKGFTNPQFNSNISNLFIYSDQQAGSGLYGYGANYSQYAHSGSYFDLTKLLKAHKEKVNPKLNCFSVMTAGYDNMLIPEVLDRCVLMYGWTGNECVYAKKLIELWNNNI